MLLYSLFYSIISRSAVLKTTLKAPARWLTFCMRQFDELLISSCDCGCAWGCGCG